MAQELTTFTSWSFARNFSGPQQRRIIIADLPNFGKGSFTDVSQFVTQASVNYTMDMASELSFDILDPGLLMSKNNYFILGRDIIYQNLNFLKLQTLQFLRVLVVVALIQSSVTPRRFSR
jgi:hypothetical protein